MRDNLEKLTTLGKTKTVQPDFTTRRNFLVGLAASGAIGCISAKDLPDLGEVFPKRGRYERLSLGYVHVKAGATKPFSLLHISDTHLTAAYGDESEKKHKLREIRTQTFGGHQEEALRDSLAWAKDNVDFVLHTGDLIDWQSKANFDLVRKYYGPNVIGSVGNHEYSPDMWLSDPKETPTEEFRAMSRSQLSKAYPFDISFAAQTINGVNFITLDDVYGTFSAEQVRRFKAETAKGLPIVLAMHVPIYTDAVWTAAKKFWVNWKLKGQKFTSAIVPAPEGDCLRQREDPITRDFIDYLRKEPLLKAILAGHLHIDVQDRFSSTANEYVVGGNFLFHGQEVLFT